MEDFAHAMAGFVRDHQAWAAPIVLLLAFGESLAFISLLIPAWGALVAIGALIGASGTEARSGPKNRPMKMLGTPHFFTKASPRGRISG